MIRHVTPVSRKAATGPVARVYEGMRREFGVHAEPIALHSPDPELLAGAWMLCREIMVARGRVDRALKEAVATTVSYVNRCLFCVDAHSVMLGGLGALGVARQIDAWRLDAIEDPRMAAVVRWAAATREPGAPQLEDPPFGVDEAQELVGTALLFHYINRPVSVFLGETPLPTRHRLLHGGMLAVGSRRFRAFARAHREPGETLELLPDAELPADMAWAAGAPAVAGAWARFIAAAERAGRRALPDSVRARVGERLGEWQGEEPGLGREWLEQALEGLDARERAATRLALLSALAPYRVDDEVVRDYRARSGAGDAELVGAVAWAALAAARRVGSWIARPARVHAADRV
jgi:AhpD family alkylhydroperoxidase